MQQFMLKGPSLDSENSRRSKPRTGPNDRESSTVPRATGIEPLQKWSSHRRCLSPKPDLRFIHLIAEMLAKS